MDKNLWCGVAVVLTLVAGHAGATQILPGAPNCGTVITEGNGDITSFNPLFSNDLANQRAAQLLYQPLVWVNRYGHIDYTRSIAAQLTVSPDRTIFTVTLRPWRWSNGTSVTAQDVVYEWQLIKDQGAAYPGYGTGGIPMLIKSLTALDAMHVQIVLKHPVNPAWFIDNGLSMLQPLPAKAWQGLSLDQLYQAQSRVGFFTVTDGPMKIQRLDIGRDAIFVANPTYDGPKMHLSRLVLEFAPSDATAMEDVESGGMDFAPLPLEFYRLVQHAKGVRTVVLSPVSFWYYIDLNYRNPKVAFFRDVRVRQALQDAIDQKQIIKVVYNGFGVPIYTPIPAVNADMLTPAMKKGVFPVGYDPQKAIALLTAAGFMRGPDGIMQKDGHRLEFTLLMTGGDVETMELVEMLQSEFRAVGIKMDIRQVAFGQLMTLEVSHSMTWDAVEHGTVLPPFPSGEGLFSATVAESSDGYADPEMTRLITQSIIQPGMAGMYAYENYAAQQQPFIFLPTEGHVELASERIHGMDGYNDGGLVAPSALYCTGP